MIKLYLKARGWNRLRWGLCPLCNSSPPKKNCYVCGGDRKYGLIGAGRLKRKMWKNQYKNYLKKRRLLKKARKK